MNPTLLNFFLVGATLGLGFIAVKWSKAGFIDFLIKSFFCVMAVLGVFITLKTFGLL